MIAGLLAISGLLAACGEDTTDSDVISKKNSHEDDVSINEDKTFDATELYVQKPIIYIYPEQETDVTVDLTLKNGEFTCVYPKALEKDEACNSIEWEVTAYPDGTLVSKDTGIELYSLYWEGKEVHTADFSTGFCIKGENTADFLNTTLRKLGLNSKETEEFILYWLPKLQKNKYNIISFDTNSYNDSAELNIIPTPDNIIRVMMNYKAADNYIDIPEPNIDTPDRNGYTVVEWGGTEFTEQ